MIVCYELTTFPCINLTYVPFMGCIYKLLLLFIFYFQRSVCTVPTLIGAHGGEMVEAPRYKLEGRGIDSRWCHWNFSFT
jgi:hypothetical protein